MAFADRYISSLSSTDLRDDATHHKTDALQAAAFANDSARGIGSLLARVKYADTLSVQFEDGNANLAQLARAWLAIVTEKGAFRKWIRTDDVAKIGQLAPMLYKRVADASLAHYLDGKCCDCRGSGVAEDRRICGACKGNGAGNLPPMSHYEARLTMEMYGELMELESSHSGAANVLLRRAEFA